MKKRYAVTALAVSLLGIRPVWAVVPVTVDGSIPITLEVMPAMRVLQATLSEILTTEMQIGTAIVQASDKQVAVITESARAQRETDIFGRQTERLERAREQYTVADSICSESASGMAATVGKVSRSNSSTLATGSGVSSAVVRKTIASLPVAPRQGGYRSAAMHAAYCTESEAAQYGGTDLRPCVCQALPVQFCARLRLLALLCIARLWCVCLLPVAACLPVVYRLRWVRSQVWRRLRLRLSVAVWQWAQCLCAASKGARGWLVVMPCAEHLPILPLVCLRLFRVLL